MTWFRRAIDRGVERGVNDALREFSKPGGKLDRIVSESFDKIAGLNLPDDAPMNRLQFTFAIAQALGQAGMRPAERCRARGIDILAEVLRDEKIQFGDPDWDWNRTAARVLAYDYEIEHWEARP